MTDRLILGGIVFETFEYAPPTRMPFGGQQAMVVHKLPGGSRVVDTLGPDEDDITWSGFFHSNNALAKCQALDAMRASGRVVSLTFAGMFRSVLVKSFKPAIRRFPHWVEYSITCLVTINPALGALGGTFAVTGVGLPSGGAPASANILISSDLSTALKAATE